MSEFRRRLLKIISQWNSGEIDYTKVPLTFKCRTGGDLSIKNENTSYDRSFEYSLNNGAWTAFSLPASSGVLLVATLSPGDIISFRRDSDDFYQAQFVSDSNLTFDIYGNLLSMQYGSVFIGKTALRNTSKQAFGYTFKGTNVVDASNLKLPALTLSIGCYQAMFQGCALLVSAPELPATTVAQSCYRSMFAQCASLVNVPSILPATNLSGKTECYRAMFYDCTSLVNAPELPATTLGQGSYYQMFYHCASLVIAPELPAAAIYAQTYLQMFRNCSSLVTVPAILATTASGGESCHRMFMGCTSLNYVKCLLTNRSGNRPTYEWLNGVAATGTFVKAPNATWELGISGIPTGWTVIDDINGYTVHNWLQTDGSSYIDLGIPANANMKITGSFDYGTIPGWTSVDDVVWAISFGNIDVYMNWYRDSNAYMRIVGRSNNFQAYTRLSSSFNKPYYCMRLDCSESTYKNAIQYSVSTTRLQVPDLSTSLTSVSSANNSALTPTYVNNLYVFKANGFDNNNERTPNGFKCYGINIYENDTLTHRYIPVIKNNTGEAGLYDTINESFFGNANPGSILTAGY